MQVTTGFFSLLSSPFFYRTFQSIMGRNHAMKMIVKEWVRPFSGQRILDLGCGPADILEYLPREIVYVGYDISEPYISYAAKKFGSRGTFNLKIFSMKDVEINKKFDLVIAVGLLHHINDEEAIDLINLAKSALAEGGRFLSIDPCYITKQNPIARFLISNDRGQCVRDLEGYRSLAEKVFKKTHTQIKHKQWIPYTHCIMECIKSD